MLTYDFENVDCSLYEYIYKCIKSDIICGNLKAGEKLPSKRAFATNNGISIITVQNAYEQLIGEGYIYAKPKKGYYVSEIDGILLNGIDEKKKVSFDIDIPLVIRDSKQMTQKMRADALTWIKENTVWAVGMCSPQEIDKMNILHASMEAMRRAIDGLNTKPDFCLIDGNRMPQNVVGRAVVKGDAKSLSIAAASIIAKETRDKIMCDLAQQYPQYGWDKNAGYPTGDHLRAIEKYGINDCYRKTYKPVRERIQNETAHD